MVNEKALVWDHAEDKFYAKWLADLPALDGKVIAITGTTTGAGYYATIFAIRKNAKTVLLLNRESSRSKEALEKLNAEKAEVGSDTELVPIACDLMDFASVEAAAKAVNDYTTESGLDVLANNAGIMAFPDNRTKDGYDVQMQTNHLSHFLLTKLLMPSLALATSLGREVRVCQHSSTARNYSGVDLKPKYFHVSKPGGLGGNGPLAKGQRYHQTKLAAICFALALHNRVHNNQLRDSFNLNPALFKSVCADPGVADTNLFGNIAAADSSFITRFSIFVLEMIYHSRHSAADGSLGLIQACFGADVDSGDFFFPNHGSIGYPVKALAQGKLNVSKHDSLALNPKNQNILWDESEKVCGPF